jgi:hypothetical protein
MSPTRWLGVGITALALWLIMNFLTGNPCPTNDFPGRRQGGGGWSYFPSVDPCVEGSQ